MSGYKFNAMPEFTDRQIARFWGKVFATEPSDCWLWAGCKNNKGYGKMTVPINTTLLSHRVSYFLSTGIAPGEQCVLHRCDNPPCCNPAHLWLGTVIDNNADMIAKGRFRGVPFEKGRESTMIGRSHHKATKTLSEIDVYLMREMYSSGLYTHAAIGKMFGVNYKATWAIVRGKSWTHVPMPSTEKYVGSRNYSLCKYR